MWVISLSLLVLWALKRESWWQLDYVVMLPFFWSWCEKLVLYFSSNLSLVSSVECFKLGEGLLILSLTLINLKAADTDVIVFHVSEAFIQLLLFVLKDVEAALDARVAEWVAAVWEQDRHTLILIIDLWAQSTLNLIYVHWFVLSKFDD